MNIMKSSLLLLALLAISLVGCGADTPINPINEGIPVAILFDQRIDAGVTNVTWDQRDANGKLVGPGQYFIEFRTYEYLAYSGFTIVETAPIVEENDNGGHPSNPPVPNVFVFDMTRNVYGVGDAIEIEFAVPVATWATLTVLRRDPNKF